ncbi:LolA family protein [Halopiger thermotolerans]
MRRRRLLAAGVAALAGCVSVPSSDADNDTDTDTGTDAPSSDALLQEAIETRAGIDDLAATRRVELETPTTSATRTERVFSRPPAAKRIEVLESTDPNEPAGSVAVTNRTVTWEYDPESNVVEKQFHPNKTDTDRTRLVLEKLRDAYRLEYAGTETVDGREVHAVEARPPLEETGPAIELLVGDSVYAIPLDPSTDLEELTISRTVLIDDEYRYPVGERNAVRDGDGKLLHRTAVTYADLAIDEGLPAGTFTYEPPADATIEREGTKPEGVFDSIEAAEGAVPYDLPNPEVPDPFVLDRVTVVERSAKLGTTVTLWYTDSGVNGRDLFVAVRETQRFDADSSALAELAVEGVPTTTYYQDGKLETIFWTCERGSGLSYRVASPAIDEAEPLREIAASIGCS